LRTLWINISEIGRADKLIGPNIGRKNITVISEDTALIASFYFLIK